MIVEKLEKEDMHEYDKLADISFEGTIFHESWWLSLFDSFYKSYNIGFYGAFENGNLVAGIPIPIHKKIGLNFIYNPKLTPYLGSFFINKSKEKRHRELSWKKEIDGKFAESLREQGICLYYSFGHTQRNLLPFSWHGFDIGVHYTYILKVEDLNKVWVNMDRKRRNDITSSFKQNYTIKFGDIGNYIELNKRTMERQDHKILNHKLWTQIYYECKKYNRCDILTAHKDDEPIASLFLVWDKKRSYYIGGGINESFKGAMSMLIWEAIKYTREKLNLNEFDFEGSGVPSIEFYFRKFGGELTPIFFISESSLRKNIIMRIYRSFSL